MIYCVQFQILIWQECLFTAVRRSIVQKEFELSFAVQILYCCEPTKPSSNHLNISRK